jgi:tetratricopeptide (TPR) repeat protein
MRKRASLSIILCLAIVVVSAGLTVAAENPSAAEHSDHHAGAVSFPISCSEDAQPQFNRAMALLHHMTYPEARHAFEGLTNIDPSCAMAHWGVAMTLFQPLWPTRPSSADLERGWDEVQKAQSLSPPTKREQLFVAATEAFFSDPKSADYWARIRRWEAAMEKAFAAFPDDPEVGAFYALAHLATAPADSTSHEHSDRAAEILLRIYGQNPDHPGAMHYLIHANDVPGRERESLEITRKYESLAPRNPHALHMPTHIYTRLGDWDGSIRGNVKAAEAALGFPVGDRAQYVWDEFPHAIEYLIYAELQKGADEIAAAQLKRLRETANLEPSFKTAFHLSSTAARFALERRAWDDAAKLIPREPASLAWDRFPWPEAITRFARGLGAAHLGKTSEAQTEIERLKQLEESSSKAGETLFARNIQVLRLELSAWLAHVEGEKEKSVALMRQAADLEAATPKHAVTPGPTLPAFELLGDLLMEQKQPAEALTAYQRSLEFYPGRFNGVLGAARAARALGDQTRADAFYIKLVELADKGGRPIPLKEAHDYLTSSRK